MNHRTARRPDVQPYRKTPVSPLFIRIHYDVKYGKTTENIAAQPEKRENCGYPITVQRYPSQPSKKGYVNEGEATPSFGKHVWNQVTGETNGGTQRCDPTYVTTEHTGHQGNKHNH